MTSSNSATVSAIVITRHRPEVLRETLASILRSTVPINELVVSDDSTDLATRDMLQVEFPSVVWTKGPQRGISANRNHGTRVATSDYILLLDDDILIHRRMVEAALERVAQQPNGLYFPCMREGEHTFLATGLTFLGFLGRPYREGELLHTANTQCFIMRREIALKEPWDEIIQVYGYEEIEYGYRLAASGCPLIPLPEIICDHMCPGLSKSIFVGRDANRLYVTFKRYTYIDRKPLKGLFFAAVAIPHHFLASLKRAGWHGVADARANLGIARSLLNRYRHEKKTSLSEPQSH